MDAAEAELAFSQDEDVRSMLNSGIEAVKLAVELGADVNAANQAGDTALHGAAYHGFETVIQFLVSKGARLDAEEQARTDAVDGGGEPRRRRRQEHRDGDGGLASQTGQSVSSQTSWF